MRRISALALVLALMLTPLLGMAEADTRKRADTLIVGHTTMLNGNFFSELWGNNTADIDVRSLLHEYPLVAWTQGGEYRLNQTVVESLNRQEEPNGDVTYTVTLKPGLQYSDGSPIVARDYAFSFLLLSSPQVKQLTNLNADYAQIVGFEDYSSGSDAVFSGIRLLAERQFSVRIKSAYLPYFYELSYIHAYPYPITVLAPGCDVRDEGEGAYILGET